MPGRRGGRRYGGDVEAALIAYNGGPERADNWLKAGRDDSVIPAETRQYYKAVLGRVETGGGGPVDVAFKQLPFDDQLKVMDKAERAASVEFSRWQDRYKDHIANIENFGVGLKGFDVEEAARFAAPEMVAELRGREEQAFQDHEALRAVRFGTREEAVAVVNEATPDQGTADIADQLNRHDRLIQALEERQKALRDDPAAYVQHGFEDVRAAFGAAFSTADPDPAQVEHAVELSLQAQERLGVAKPRRRVLPAGVAEGIVERVEQAPAAEAAVALDARLAPYGKYRDKALHDLRRAGLSDDLYIAQTYVEHPLISSRIAAVAGVKEAELAAGLHSTEPTDVETTLGDKFREYRAIWLFGDRSTGSQQQFNALFNVAKKLALREVSLGKDVGSAAETAYDMLVTQHVTLVDGGRVVALVPKQFNAALVEDGGEVALERSQLDKLKLEPFDSPQPEFIDQSRIRSSVGSRGVWIYAGDGESLRLVVPLEDGSTFPVSNTDGDPVLLSFAEAERLGAQVRGTRTPAMIQPFDVIEEFIPKAGRLDDEGGPGESEQR